MDRIENCLDDEPFKIGGKNIRNPVLHGLEWVSGLKRCQQLYSGLDVDSCEGFSGQVLDSLGVDYRVDEKDLGKIPRSGSCILIANHPFGGIDGVVLMNLIERVRSDFKVMGNGLLARIPQLRDKLIQVDPFGGTAAAKKNISPLRQALKALQRGELLIMFPGGEVSTWHNLRPQAADPDWSSTLPRLVRMSQAAVLPVYFRGDNGCAFHLAGKIHPRLRTLLLPRMMLKQRGKRLQLGVGQSIPSKKLLQLGDAEMLETLRMRTYALAGRWKKQKDRLLGKKQLSTSLPVAAPVAAELLDCELKRLPLEQRLVVSGGFRVYYAGAVQIPNMLSEIGRLREETFRRVGEGTGRERDLDRFDQNYLHLMLWDEEQQQLVGAYRIGQVDRILAQFGSDGLYSSTLFKYSPKLFRNMSNSLELGRSFVRSEYQRSYAPLLMLWKGIGHFIKAHPHYRYLFGPVSISNDYSKLSRELMTSGLTRNFQIEELANLVTPRVPVSVKSVKISGVSRSQKDLLLRDIDQLSDLVADLEPDCKGIPVLLRHYLNLGGKLLAFNLDSEFSDVIDGLLLVDMLEADKRQLQRYMGRDGFSGYLNFQNNLSSSVPYSLPRVA